VPQFGEATAVEEALQYRILDEAGLPYVRVRLDPTWHLPGDAHPDARGAQAIAAAVVARLRLNGAASASTAQWKGTCGLLRGSQRKLEPDPQWP